MTDDEAQRDELLALASIFDEECLTLNLLDSENAGCRSGTFKADVILPQSFSVCLRLADEAGAASIGTPDDVVYFVEELPPIVMSFVLPVDYPSRQPPHYDINCCWMSPEQLEELRARLDSDWQDNQGNVILFTWLDFLRTSSIDHLHIRPPLAVNRDQLYTVLDHDRKRKYHRFRSGTVYCPVCLRTRPGTECCRLDECGHAFCTACLRDYLESKIADGATSAIGCPSEDCVAKAHLSQVKDLVSDETFARYDRLLLQSSLDGMSDVTYCPRPHCASAVLLDKDGNSGSCPVCHYAFCAHCKKTYHGLAPCHLGTADTRSILEQYTEGSEEERLKLERRYRKDWIKKLVEECRTLDWIGANSKQCPRCATNIQKIDGCNKMACTKCRVYFCWLCLKILHPSDPYAHFRSTTECAGKLFHIDDRQPEAELAPLAVDDDIDLDDYEDVH